jgi:hypothetical protein
VPIATLLAESNHEEIFSVSRRALPLGDPIRNTILALELGQTSGWPVCNSDGAIASNMAGFGVGRFERSRGLPPVRAWLEDVDQIARGAGAAPALLYWALAQGSRR